MTYPVFPVTEHTTSGTGSQTLPLPTHADGDYVVIWSCMLSNTSMTTPTGWTSVTVSDAGAGRSYLYYRQASGGTLSDPSITPIVDGVTFQFVVIRGASSVGTATHASSSTGVATASALTLTQDPQLVMVFVGGERFSENPYFAAGEVMEAKYIDYTPLGPRQGVAYTYTNNAAARTYRVECSAVSIDTTPEVCIAAIPFVDGGGGIVAPYAKLNSSELLYRGIRDVERYSKTLTDPTDAASSPQITSITHDISGNVFSTGSSTLFYQAPLSGGALDKSIHWDIQWETSPSYGTGSGDTDKLNLVSYVLGSSQDLSNSLIAYSTFLDKKGINGFDDCGEILGFGDGTNVSFFAVGGLDDSRRTGLTTTVINTADSATFEIATVGAGSVNWSAITTIYIGFNVNSTDLDPVYGQVTLMDKTTILGGSASSPCSFADVCDATRAGIVNTGVDQGSTQFFFKNVISIGDGVNDVYFNSTGQGYEFPAAYNYANGVIEAQVSAGVLGVEINATSGSTVILASTAGNSGNFHYFTEESTTADADIYDYNGLSLVKTTVTLRDKSNIDRTGMFISNSPAVAHNASTTVANSSSVLNGVTIDSVASGENASIADITTETQFANVVSGATFTNNTNAPAIRITGNQSHTGSGWADPGLTVSGNTVDIEYTGDTDFTIQSAATLTVSNTGLGVLTIATPTTDVTINSNVAATIRLYDGSSTQTITDSATAATQLVYTYSGTHTWYATVDAEGYLPQRVNTGSVTDENATINVTLEEDPIYNSSHGLTFGTEFSYNSTTRVITIDGATHGNQEGRDIYSGMISAFFDGETTTRNRPFPLKAIGPDRIDFLSDGTTGATLDSGDIQFWKGAGMVWEHDTTGNPTKKFYSIKSSNTLQASTVVGYTQENTGTPVEATLVSNQVNQVIQFFEDTNGDGTPDYNRDSHLLFKAFLTGYYQARWDVVNDGGISTLEPYEYTIALTQEAIAGTTGDQSVSPAITTLTDHTASPLTAGGKSYDYELVDPGTNTAEVLLAQHNYNVYAAVNAAIDGSLYTSYQAFDVPDLIIEAGSSYETEAGYFEGDGLVTDRSGVYVSRGVSDHPDMLRFQSNDLTYYQPATQAQIAITNLSNEGNATLLEIYNITGAAVFYSGDPGATSYSETYLDGDTQGRLDINAAGDRLNINAAGDDLIVGSPSISAGDSIRIRYADLNGSTAFKSFQTIVTAAASGFSLDASLFLESDAVYASNATDGSGAAVLNKFAADYVDNELDLQIASNFTAAEAYAAFCYFLTTSDGINQFWGGVEAEDPGNYEIQTSTLSLKFDNLTTTNLRQTDTARIYRDDGAYPIKDDGVTTGGGGIDINWKNQVFVTEVNTGSAVNKATVIEALTDQGYTSARAPALDTVTTIDTNVDTLTTNLATVDTNVDSTLTKVTDIHNAEGLDQADPVVISGDGETSSTITTGRVTKTITPTSITRSA